MALVLICGISFSGKSTFAELVATALPAQVVSLDEINRERGLIGGHGLPVEEWAQTYLIVRERARHLLLAGSDVIVDDTGSLRALREQWRALAGAAHAPFVLVWMRTDHTLRRRRLLANRAHPARDDVTDEVMHAHVTTFEAPTGEAPVIVDGADSRSAARVAQIVQTNRAAT